MKLYPAILLLSSSMAACQNSAPNHSTIPAFKRDTITAFKIRKQGLDTVELFKKLYPGGNISRESSVINKFRLLVSKDFEHKVNIDTIMKIPGDKNNACVVILTSFLYSTSGDRDESHAGSAIYDLALLSKESGTYKIVNVARNIDTADAWGEGGEISFMNFGKEYVLRLASGYEGQGELYAVENFYATDSARFGTRIFSYVTDHDNTGNYDYDPKTGSLTTDGDRLLTNFIMDKRKVEVSANSNGSWDELKLKCIISRYDTVSQKVKDSTYFELYKMNDGEYIYEKAGK